jgi:hypothetical protein
MIELLVTVLFSGEYEMTGTTSFTVMLTKTVDEPSAFVAVMVYIVRLNKARGVPEMLPVVVLKSSPFEREGVIENPLTTVEVDWTYIKF